MYILGLNAFHGDSSACIFQDGKLILAIEEERLRRIKHWAGVPTEAIKACLKEASINITDVDHITISRNPSANVVRKIRHSFGNIFRLQSILHRFGNLKNVSSLKSILAEKLNVPAHEIKAQFHNIEHHRSHLASTFFASQFNEAALLSIDGFGDFTSTMTGFGKDKKFEVFGSVIFPHSLGTFYTAFTQFLGFENYGDEYKVMGLAPYGKPIFADKIRKMIKPTPDGFFKLNTKYFSHSAGGGTLTWNDGSPVIDKIFSDKFIEELGQPCSKNDKMEDFQANIAASVQLVTEEIIFHILRHLYKRTGSDNICIAGGVAQNSVANGKILKNTPFKNIYIPSAATDAGTAIGSALYLYNQILDFPRIASIRSANLGQKFEQNDIESLLSSLNVAYEKLSDQDINNRVADCLIGGGVVGWFKHRSEFGPRALGYRSILADPRRKDAKEILNLKIKRREPFRPFAPSILSGFEHEYFEESYEVPFMEKVYPVRPEKHEIIPAVTHVDGSGRLQSVFKEENPLYYNMIYAFYEKTGVPIVLNTSFNENEPIVNTPQEALACFQRTSMDMLVMENLLVTRK